MEFCQLFNFYHTAHPFFLCQSLLIRPGSGIKQHPQIHHSACAAVITKEIRFIGKISHGNKQCDSRVPVYEFISQESKPVKATAKEQNIQRFPEGKFLYSTYQQIPGKDTSFGKDYTLTISRKGCKLDIVGYQVDTHVECELKNIKDINIIEVYDKTNGSKFGEMKQNKNGDLLLNITYYDAFNDKADNKFYPMEKQNNN